MDLIERHANTILGVLSTFDRMLISGSIPGWCYADGMTSFLYEKGIRVFDFPKFANTKRLELRKHMQRIAHENGVAIEFIHKFNDFRKEDRISKIIQKRGTEPGLVHIFSAMESCRCYQPWYDKQSGRAYLRSDSSSCLHYYVYFIDTMLGLCYLRIPTWCPYRLQFYCNGHNWLASELKKHNIDFTLHDNAFFSVSDFAQAQRRADSFRMEKLHTVLDAIAKRYCPVAQAYKLGYQWNIEQIEYSYDILFRTHADLAAIYHPLVRTITHAIKPDNIATFFGRKLHPLYCGEMGNDFQQRILGTRIKHRMGANSIKMYDKYGIIIRIEVTVNDVTAFKHYRQVQSRQGPPIMKNAPMKKSIYSLHDLSRILHGAITRYLDHLSTFDDPSQGVKHLRTVSKTVKIESRSYKGFNFFDEEDQKLFETIAEGGYTVTGFTNKSLRRRLPDKSRSSISRILKRLRVHHLIKRVSHTYRYYLTNLGKHVIATGMTLKEMFITPQLVTTKLSYR